MLNESSGTFLISELKAGNARAFDMIFLRFYPNLCRYCHSIIKDKDKAQSLVQNAFVKIWERKEILQDVEHLSAYLTAMVRNESLNHLKREKRNINLSIEEIEIQSDLHDEVFPAVNDFAGKLVIAISMLPERCRQAFEYSRLDELSNVEIAEKMGISTKGVEALITRSLRLLRKDLSEFLPSAREKSLPGDTLFLLIRRFKAFA